MSQHYFKCHKGDFYMGTIGIYSILINDILL